MTIFKGYLKIMQKNTGMIFMYFGIFLGIFFMISATEQPAPVSSFAAARLNVTVIDRDKGPLAAGLTEYLGEKHNLIDLPDKKNVLQEELFNRHIDYILFIPEDFEDICINRGEPLNVTKVPGSYTGYYMDQDVDLYLNQIRIYTASGYSITEAIDAAWENLDLKADVSMMDQNAVTSAPRYYYLLRLIPYLAISIMCYGVSLVMLVFRRRDLKMRLSCVPVMPTWQNLQAMLSFLVLAVIYLAICLLLPCILDGKNYLTSQHLPYHIINTALCMGISLALAFLIGMAAKSSMIITNLTTVLSLCLCFLGGTFVPVDFLSESIVKVAQFNPVYWYEKINDTLILFPKLTAEAHSTVRQGILIQSIFIVALLCIGLVIGKHRAKEQTSL